MTQALAEIGISTAFIERLRQSESEREKLTQLLARAKGGSDRFTEVSQRVRQKTLELKEALTGDATNEARQIIATLMGPIGIEQSDDAYFASYDDISERLLVCAAGKCVFGWGCGDRI